MLKKPNPKTIHHILGYMSNLVHMKRLWILLLPLVFACNTSKYSLSIPANDAIVLRYDLDSRLDIRNLSKYELSLQKFADGNEDQISGFGISPDGEVSVTVNTNNSLRLENPGDEKAVINLTVKEIEATIDDSKPQSIDIILENSSSTSIPLIIPGVMNPNLSPNSLSRVSLDPGQEIFLNNGMKKELLLMVDETIQAGDTIDVAALIGE